MPQFGFGSGTLFGIDSSTPAQAAIFGALQEVQLDFSFTNKELHGAYQFPLDVARGKSKIDGKAKVGQIRADVYSALFFGQAKVSGQTLVVVGEAGTIPTTPYQVTVANSATWILDLGVMNNLGKPMIRVASGPATGQYSVAAGVYTFAAADTGQAVSVSYTYTTATGFTTTINNQLLGASPIFSVVINQLFEGKQMTIILNKCLSSKLAIPTKLDEFVITGFDFSAMADATGVVGKIALSE